jgi:hypothetical protein
MPQDTNDWHRLGERQSKPYHGAAFLRDASRVSQTLVCVAIGEASRGAGLMLAQTHNVWRVTLLFSRGCACQLMSTRTLKNSNSFLKPNKTTYLFGFRSRLRIKTA